MRSRYLSAAALAIGLALLQGCSSNPPKEGVPIEAGDYMHAPGGGAKPANPAAAPASPGN